MDIEIKYRPAHALARIGLALGESVVAEAGAMVGMSTNVQMQTQSGGMMGGLKRMFGGESFFRNTFTAQGGPGELLLAHAVCGDMNVLEMTPTGYFIQSGGFVACSPNVNIETVRGGVRGFFSGTGIFMLKATATAPGQVLIGAFGGVQELACDGNLIVDTGHLVAWDASLQYKVGKSSTGWISSFLSGEGLVCEFQGQGRIWIQTRNTSEYGKTIGPMLPPA
jgi:uncharacterized protein (TIGR00266 family)